MTDQFESERIERDEEYEQLETWFGELQSDHETLAGECEALQAQLTRVHEANTFPSINKVDELEKLFEMIKGLSI